MPGKKRACPATAVLFAGGKSSRMGEDKSLLPFGGYTTLSEYQYRRLEKLFGKVYISSKSDKFDFNVALIPDRYEESSPLVALLSTFETIDASECFILSVDAPFVDESVIERLCRAASGRRYDAIVAESPQGIEPLCGIYRRSITPLAAASLAEGNHKLLSLLKRAETLFVPFEEESPFENLNHPHEYKKALRRSGL